MSGTEVEEAWRTTQEPSRCSSFLTAEKCSMLGDLAVAHDHVRAAVQDRLDELGDVGAAVLVVGVGVDDHVGTQLQRRVDAGLEGGRQPLVVGQAHEVLDAEGAGDLDRAVAGAVVDDEPLDLVEARNLAWEVRERLGKLLGLVEAGNLDDQLHRSGDLPRLARTQYPKAQDVVFALRHRAAARGCG